MSLFSCSPWVLGRCWAHGPQLQWEAQAGQAAQSVGSCPGAQTTAWGEGTLSLPWWNSLAFSMIQWMLTVLSLGFLFCSIDLYFCLCASTILS